MDWHSRSIPEVVCSNICLAMFLLNSSNHIVVILERIVQQVCCRYGEQSTSQQVGGSNYPVAGIFVIRGSLQNTDGK